MAYVGLDVFCRISLEPAKRMVKMSFEIEYSNEQEGKPEFILLLGSQRTSKNFKDKGGTRYCLRDPGRDWEVFELISK